MNQTFNKVIIGGLMLVSMSIWSQQKKGKDTIGTQSVVVIKSFNPTINDVHKIKENPKITDKSTADKMELEYQINSVPVPSTFTPKKTKPVELTRDKSVKQYDRYVRLGLGNYFNVDAEAFAEFDVARYTDLTLLLEYLSSKGGIKSVNYDHGFSDLNFLGSLENQSKRTGWSLDLGVSRETYNWYGISDQISFSQEVIDNTDLKQRYLGISISGDYKFDSELIPKVGLAYHNFTNKYNSREGNIVLTPEFNINTSSSLVKMPVVIDALFGSFDNPYTLIPFDNYGFVNIGVLPSMRMNFDEVNVEAGLKLFMSLNSNASGTNFHLYPNIEATYQIPQSDISVFGGLVGGLQQNTYREATQDNPFAMPLLTIEPTSRAFNMFAGAKGSWKGNLSYEAQLSLARDSNRPFWKQQPALIDNPAQAYSFANAFTYVYDRLTTIGLDLYTDYSLEKQYGFACHTAFMGYSVKNEAEAWNLPSVQADVSANYYATPELNISTYLVYTGAREAFDSIANQAITLGGFFDANIKGSYVLNKQWQLSLMGNNLFSTNYQLWQNYSVQGFQVLFGAKYKF